MTVVVLLVAVFATYRLTRIITTDHIGEIIRRPAMKYDWTDELVTCAWCIGFWISTAVTLTLYLTSSLVLEPVVWWMLPFALSTTTGIIAETV